MKITADTPLVYLTVSQLRELISSEISKNIPQGETPNPVDGEAHIYGLNGLADFLGCSIPTAARIKKSGKVPFLQFGRKMIFNKAEVTKSLSNYRSKK